MDWWLSGLVARWIGGSVTWWLGGLVAQWFGCSVAGWIDDQNIVQKLMKNQSKINPKSIPNEVLGRSAGGSDPRSLGNGSGRPKSEDLCSGIAVFGRGEWERDHGQERVKWRGWGRGGRH